MKFILAFLGVGLMGCFHLQPMEVPEYKISKSGPFIVSESPELWKVFERSLPKEERRLTFLITNLDSKTHKLLLENATLTIYLEEKSVFCESMASREVGVVLSQNQVAQINCKLDVVPNSVNQLATKDSLSKLEIPTDAGAVIVVERVLRFEDFK